MPPLPHCSHIFSCLRAKSKWDSASGTPDVARSAPSFFFLTSIQKIAALCERFHTSDVSILNRALNHLSLKRVSSPPPPSARAVRAAEASALASTYSFILSPLIGFCESKAPKVYTPRFIRPHACQLQSDSCCRRFSTRRLMKRLKCSLKTLKHLLHVWFPSHQTGRCEEFAAVSWWSESATRTAVTHWMDGSFKCDRTPLGLVIGVNPGS